MIERIARIAPAGPVLLGSRELLSGSYPGWAQMLIVSMMYFALAIALPRRAQ